MVVDVGLDCWNIINDYKQSIEDWKQLKEHINNKYHLSKYKTEIELDDEDIQIFSLIDNHGTTGINDFKILAEKYRTDNKYELTIYIEHLDMLEIFHIRYDYHFP